MKPIRLSGHAIQQLTRRGVLEEEVREAIRLAEWQPAEMNRLECQMKITYDPEVDALYIQFLETTVTTEHLAEGIAADYDTEGHLAGIEILNALKRLGGPHTFRQVILEDVGLVNV